MSDDQDRTWDDEFAQKLPGSILLVGLTYSDSQGDRSEEIWGEVVSADRKDGIVLRLAGGREGDVFRLPPDLRSVAPARPGSYRLRSTGEIVENPDFTATWIIHPKST